MLPYISVIIPSLNRQIVLRESLYSVLTQDTKGTFEFEILVVLDKKDEESKGWLDDEALLNTRLKVYRADSPGVNSARNLGIKESKGEIIYFIDDDCILPKKSQLIDLSESFKNYPDAAAIGGGYILADKKNDIFSVSRNKMDNYYLEANKSFTERSGALLGGNTAYRNKTFVKYGLFDERLHYGSAETEFNDRIIKDDGKLYYVKGFSVLHSVEKLNLKAYLFKSFMQGMGKAYSLAKNGTPMKMLNHTPKRTWFILIGACLNAGLEYRVIATAFLLLNAACYWTGLLFGKTMNQVVYGNHR